MKKIFIVLDTYPFANADCNIICVGESMSAVIDGMIEMGLIRGDTQVTPLATGNAQFLLEDYLPSWKTEVRLLTKNEFNDWFRFCDYEAWEYELFTDKK